MDLMKFLRDSQELYSLKHQIDLNKYFNSLTEEPRVIIKYDLDLWVVTFLDWSEFWLASFTHHADAIDFCDAYQFNIVDT